MRILGVVDRGVAAGAPRRVHHLGGEAVAQTVGDVEGHFHTHSNFALAVLILGIVTGQREYLSWARQTYEVLKAWGTDFGWFPEGFGLRHGEVCCITDMIELALLLPFLVTSFLGIFEIGRGLLVKEALSNAAQRACRTGAQPGKANSDVTQDVDDVMASAGISGHSATVLINDVPGDVKTAKRHDKVSVKVSVPVSKVFWLTTYFVKNNQVESETVVMVRQG